MSTMTSWNRIALVAVAGCAASSSYLYAPQDATLWSDGYPAAVTAVPPEAPQGKVEVSSFGVVEITPDGVGPINVLHVRAAIVNDGDATPWTIAPSEQLVEIAGEGRSGPIYVNSDLQTLPVITVAARERRVLDFYYPLPPGIQDDDDLPGFEFLWQVTTPARSFSSRTRFLRQEQEPAPTTQVVLYSGWGPYWWYDPFYPHRVFVHAHPIVIHRPGHVIISRPPSRHYRAIHDHHRR